MIPKSIGNKPTRRSSPQRACKDCGSTTRQMIDPKTGKPYPGPRCCTCHRAKKKADRKRAHQNRTAKTYGEEWGQLYDELKKFQGDHCAICQRNKGKTRNLAVDHDHKCCPGKESCGACVRGLLCSPCNSMLAHARDESGFFLRAWIYLQAPPAQQFRQQKEAA